MGAQCTPSRHTPNARAPWAFGVPFGAIQAQEAAMKSFVGKLSGLRRWLTKKNFSNPPPQKTGYAPGQDQGGGKLRGINLIKLLPLHVVSLVENMFLYRSLSLSLSLSLPVYPYHVGYNS